jgi:hypothetical protein
MMSKPTKKDMTFAEIIGIIVSKLVRKNKLSIATLKGPKRLNGESFKKYRFRRAVEGEYTKQYLRGRWLVVSRTNRKSNRASMKMDRKVKKGAVST